MSPRLEVAGSAGTATPHPPGRVPLSDRVLADAGSAVELRTDDDQLTACVAWGAGRC